MIHWATITHLALDHLSGTKHKTPTWYAFYCLLEFIGGCLHVPVALSKQCDLLPVSPSSLTPRSPSKCCVLCSDPLTAQSTFSRMEIDHSIPPSHPPSWQFSYPLIPALKKNHTIINNCSQFTCHDFIDPPHILFRLLFSRPWLTLKLLAFLPKLAEVFSWPIGQGMHVVFGGRCLAGLLWSRSSDLSGWISFSLCKASGL